MFSYDTSNRYQSDIISYEEGNLSLNDSISSITADSSIFIEGKILANEGFTTSLLALDGIKMEHALEITNAIKFEVDSRFLSAGEEFIVEMDKNKEILRSFSYIPNPVTTHKLTRNIDGSLEYELITLPTEKRYRYVRGEITSTLNQAMFDYDIEPSVAAVAYGILECVVNFRSESRKGDKFSVFIEERYYNGEKLKGGNVLLASYEGKKTGYKVAYSFEDLDRNSAYNAHYTRKGEALINSSLRLPVDKVHVTSSYGYRIHPVTGKKTFHYGVDYRGSVGDPVYSVANGTVISTGYDGISGNKITIQHQDKSKTYYYHLNKIRVTQGQKVKARQRIADLGRTGRVTGPHLHFGVKDPKDKWANPQNKRMIATPKLEGERYARYLVQMEEIDNMIKDQLSKERMFTEYTLFNLGGDQFYSLDSPK